MRITHRADVRRRQAGAAAGRRDRETYSATGNLTLHGHTRRVTFTLSAERTSTAIKISGSIPVTFAKWDISNPSFGSFVTTQNHGELEFLLTLDRS
jgi:hypothetical protein